MKTCTALLLLVSISLGAVDSSWSEIFPARHQAFIMVKGSYSKDRSKDEVIPFWAIGGEYRLPPLHYEKMGGGYFQAVFPGNIYHFPTKKAVTCEIEFRPDLGPPIAQWIPLGMVDIGYSYSSKDWFTGSDESIHSLMIGGWFSIPLKQPDDGIFRLNGSTSIVGTKLTRFSCYIHWFFTNHFGVTIHGDNFIRKIEDEKFHYGSFNLGVLFRI